jgi:hypothetical protein
VSRHGRRPDERFRLGPWLIVLAVVAGAVWLFLVALEFIESTTFVG